MEFKIHSEFKPSGDQPQAIAQLVQGIENGLSEQTLLGVTGSGKTFTMASVIEKVQKPTLVLAHNHTSGIALPSREDEATTRQIRTALDAVGILLADHIIVADDDFVSMADSGFFRT